MPSRLSTMPTNECHERVAIMRNPEARDSDRLKAAEIVLDRGHGKPRQELEHSGPDGTNLVPPQEIDQTKVSLVLLNAILDVLEARKEGGGDKLSS